MDDKHYFIDCGCMFTEGETEPFYTCEKHFSKRRWLFRKQKPLMATSAVEEPIKNFNLYVLELYGGKFYVGTTAMNDPHMRIKQHGGTFGARWTVAHKPKKVIEIRELGNMTRPEAELIEQDVTLEYMSKHGYNNVRGGNLCYTGRYYKMGSRYFTERDFEALVIVLFLMSTVAVLLFTRR
jgi:predicted GIY-YIG superfamily endonuclease